jgi:alpha-glucuronidase
LGSVQAYDTFVPLDGLFDDNVILQIKNGTV